MSFKFDTIAFDADDTLWENEAFFRLTQKRFAELLADFAEADHLSERLLAAERRNLGKYGFGIKGFVLSMIETAIEVTDGNVSAFVIKELIDAGQDMLSHPITLLDGVLETLEILSKNHALILITKGDLLDQERKLAQSGLGDFFSAVEIVSEKSQATYAEIFKRHRMAPHRSIMIGNSMKSDILPPIEIGSWGLFVPHNITWAIEHAPAPVSHPRFSEISTLRDAPDALSTFVEKVINGQISI